MGFDFSASVLKSFHQNGYNEVNLNAKQKKAANSAFSSAQTGLKDCQFEAPKFYGGEGGAQVSVSGSCQGGKKVGAILDYSGPKNLSITTTTEGKTKRTNLPQ